MGGSIRILSNGIANRRMTENGWSSHAPQRHSERYHRRNLATHRLDQAWSSASPVEIGKKKPPANTVWGASLFKRDMDPKRGVVSRVERFSQTDVAKLTIGHVVVRTDPSTSQCAIAHESINVF